MLILVVVNNLQEWPATSWYTLGTSNFAGSLWTGLVKTFVHYVGVHLGFANAVVGLILMFDLNFGKPLTSGVLECMKSQAFFTAGIPFLVFVAMIALVFGNALRIKKGLAAAVLCVGLPAVLALGLLCYIRVSWIWVPSVIVIPFVIPAFLFAWNIRKPTSGSSLFSVE